MSTRGQLFKKPNLNSTVNLCELKIACLNVCGLKGKLRFEEFHDIIKCYDIFICIEINIDKFDILKLPDGYSEFTKYRKHFKKKSGGITVIFKNVFKKCLIFIETDSDFVLWFRINSFSENHNLLCGCIYIPSVIIMHVLVYCIYISLFSYSQIQWYREK